MNLFQRTPPAVLEKLQREMALIIKSPAMREKFAPLGVEMVGSTPDEMNPIVRRDGERWSRVIKDANVKVE